MTSSSPRSELRAQIELAIPLAVQQLGFQLMGAVDAAWLGRYSESAIAAAGVGNSILFAITSIGLGIVMGLDSVIPKAVGAGATEDARRYLHAGCRLAVLVGLAGMIALLATPALLGVADVADDVAADAKLYVYLRSFGVVPFFVSVALRSYLAAFSITRPLILAVVVANLVNAVLDPALIFGVDALGIPALGVGGAAIATVAVNILIPAIYYLAIRTLDGDAPRATSTRADLATIARYGAPVGGQLLAEVGIFGVATLLAANLGTLSAAGHTIALNLASFTFSVAVGVGAATSVRVGHAIGAGDRALARRRGMYGLGIGLAAMACSAAAFVLAARPIARVFTDDLAVVDAAVPLLMIAALFQLSDGAQAVLAGALRGLGDTRATFIGNVLGHYGLGLGISLLLAYELELGAPGLWWGLSAGLTGTAIYLLVRFLAHTRPTTGTDDGTDDGTNDGTNDGTDNDATPP